MTHFKWHFNKEQQEKENRASCVLSLTQQVSGVVEVQTVEPEQPRTCAEPICLWAAFDIRQEFAHYTREVQNQIPVDHNHETKHSWNHISVHGNKKCCLFISRQGTNIKTDHLALQTLGICQIMKQQKSENKQGFVDRQRLHRDSTVRSPTLTCSSTVLVQY